MSSSEINANHTHGASPPDSGICRASGQLTVYFDGSCPLCRMEIDHYASQAGADGLSFVDVASAQPETGSDLAKAAAMARFHVRRPDGHLVSGAAAFVEIWKRLPGWRHAARLAGVPGILPVMEMAYRLFLPVRPVLSGMVGWVQSRRPWLRREPR